MPDQHRFNELLGRLPQKDREVIAEMLAQEYVGGAFGALSVLNDFEVVPFEKGYEGAAYNDFVGRLAVARKTVVALCGLTQPLILTYA